MDMDMDMDRVPTPPHPTPPPWRAAERAQTVVCGRTRALDCGSRRNALTESGCFPTPGECASGQEQMCSGSRDQHSTGG